MAHMRYLLFAEIAEQEGYPNVARLFKAIAYAEQVHARNHYNRLKDLKQGIKVTVEAPFGPGDTSKNLELAIMGEEFEVSEMYPVYLEIARLQGEKQAEISFKLALEAERIHLELYKKAKEFVDKGEDIPVQGYIWICTI